MGDKRKPRMGELLPATEGLARLAVAGDDDMRSARVAEMRGLPDAMGAATR